MIDEMEDGNKIYDDDDSHVELPRRFINWGLRVDPEQNPVQKSFQLKK